MVTRVQTLQKADALVNRLLDAARVRAVILLSTKWGHLTPPVDVPTIQAAAPDADVVIIETGELTRLIANRLPAEGGAFGGAGRVYPPGVDWAADPRRFSPLRLDHGQPVEQAQQLIDDLAFLRTGATRPPVATRPPSPASSPVKPTPPKPVGVTPAIFARPGQRVTPRDVAPAPAVPTPAALAPRVPLPGVERLPSLLVTNADVYHFSMMVQSPERERPVALISRPAGHDRAFIDVERLRDDAGDLIDIYEIPTGGPTWELNNYMHPTYSVYGGAGRVYPVGLKFDGSDLARSPLRFVWNEADGPKATAALIGDALAMAFAQGYRSRTVSQATTVAASGTVTGVVGGRGLVALDGGGLATIWPELTAPDVEADRLLMQGMGVAGRLDVETKRLDVTTRSADDALQGYTAGASVLAVARMVAQVRAELELYPGITAVLPVAEAEAYGTHDLRDVLSEGETLAVRIVRQVPTLMVSLEDVDDEALLPAPALLPGGPPWLQLTAPVVAIDEVPPAEQAVALEPIILEKVPAEVTDQMNALRFELEAQRQLLAEAGHELRNLRAELSETKRSRRQAHDKLARLEKVERAHERAVQASINDEHLFPSDAEQLDFEIYVAWARRTTADEKRDLPLLPHTYGPEFFSSWASIEGIERSKVVDVLVDVLTGRDAELASRELHQMRTSEAGGAPFLTRDDGATAWRVSLQVKTPSARRLHYWRTSDGNIELASIRLHDQKM